MPGGFKGLDANSRALVHVYARDTRAEAGIAKVGPCYPTRRDGLFRSASFGDAPSISSISA